MSLATIVASLVAATLMVGFEAAARPRAVDPSPRQPAGPDASALGDPKDRLLVPETCEPPCDDGNPCTADQCKGTSCYYPPISGPCDDDNACTEFDHCSNGSCLGQKTVDCDDLNPCTDDFCDVVVGCMHKNNSNTCDDLDACTENDVCSGGSCQSGPPLDCSDGDPCTDDLCNPSGGCSNVDGTPSISQVTPRPGSEDQPASTNVTLQFSEPVQSSSVTTFSARLLDSANVPVGGTLSVEPGGLLATFDPADSLASLSLYTIEVTSAVTDLAGCPLVPFSGQFLVGAAIPNGTPLPSISQTTNPPPAASLARAGSSVSGAEDLNRDGIPDLLVGAPGYQVGSDIEAGAALVYLGSAVASELRAPDIIFTGASPHDRTGVSVAGGFDFNGDGTPDLLIGAEQVNRTNTNEPGCASGQPCGAGKAYLIYFDPTDSVHYPNFANPLVADTVSLSLVGQPGGLPGVVLTGIALGDRAGFSVTGGGRVNAGAGQDILIGAPGRDVGPLADAGSAYLIFDSTSLSGAAGLGRVANGLGNEIAGVVYRGAGAGDALGFAVAFPGDITGSAGDDLALGAPLADASQALPDAGISYVAEGGALTTGTVDVSQLGVSLDGTQFTMDQAGAQLGFALAGGGDNQADGSGDFLMGSPGYTPESLEARTEVETAAGAVFQTSGKVSRGIVDVCRTGSTAADGINGVTWTGAAVGDQLGSSVAAVSDVTGDGFEDIVLGAPFADPGAVTDAGTVYFIEGASVQNARRGTISASQVGTTQAGAALVGTQEGERAGSSLAGPGDVNAGGTSDAAVGAPGRDIALEEDAGTVYIVTRDDTDADGRADLADCDPSSSQVWGTPGEVRGDLFAKNSMTGVTTLSWPEPQPLGGTAFATRYTVYGGSASDLPHLLDASPDSCIVVVTGGRAVDIPGAPPAGSLAWYLVRASNPCAMGNAGAATAGPRIQDVRGCDDGIACTMDSCDAALGCVHAPVPSLCNDGNLCTDDSCSPVSGCVHVNNTVPCSDGNACTTSDACAGGACAGGPPLDCNDSNVCTNDSCSPASGCVHVNNTSPCSDGNACTTSDACAGGACAGGPPLDCNDGNVCTNDSCNPASGCAHVNNTVPCSDGNACTTGDACAGGACAGGPPLDCNDSNVCTNDSCNPASGCVHANNTSPCSDGSVCTMNDTCSGGVCSGTRQGATHLVISQFQHTGDGLFPNQDEFIELFNPTSSPVLLNGLSIQYKTGMGTTHAAFTLPGHTIPARGWYLIANTSYNGSPSADVTYNTTTIDMQSVGGGTLFLVNGTNPLPPSSCSNSASIIDKVGWGGTTCSEVMTTSNPLANNSKTRRPADVCGSGQDTNNNSNDFVSTIPSVPHNRFTPPAP